MPQDGLSWTIDLGKVLDRDEVGALLSVAKESDVGDYLFLTTAANTGFRLSEVLHLRAEDVRDGQVIVFRRKKKSLTAEPMYASDSVLDLLSKCAKEVGKGWLWPGLSGKCRRPRQKRDKDTGETKIVSVETLCSGGHLARRTIQRRYARYAERAGIGKWGRGIHSLRHYAITEFYEEHRDIRAAQKFAGHSSSRTTETYAHVRDMRKKIQAVKPTL